MIRPLGRVSVLLGTTSLPCIRTVGPVVDRTLDSLLGLLHRVYTPGVAKVRFWEEADCSWAPLRKGGSRWKGSGLCNHRLVNARTVGRVAPFSLLSPSGD
jgi:hypothetical protein